MQPILTDGVTPAVTPPRRNPMIAFRNHFIVFAVVVALLAALNIYLGSPYWVAYVLAGWGIGIIAHGLAAFLKRSQTSQI